MTHIIGFCSFIFAVICYINNKIKSDEVYLNQITFSFDRVYNLLKNGEKGREEWNTAARLLLKTLKLKNHITTSMALDACALEEENIRARLYLALSRKVDTQRGRVSLPLSFFRDEKKQDIKMAHLSYDKNNLVTEPEINSISKKAVVVIYDFIRFPTDYDQALENIELWKNDRKTYYGIEQAPRKYVCEK